MGFLSEAEMNVYRSYVTMIGEPGSKDESKLQAAQEINENLELISNSPQYQIFLEHMLRTFIKVMMDGQPQFISEHGVHQLRKIMLEIIYRLPNNEYLRTHVDALVSLCIKIIEIDNEEVVLVCMRIIIELTKNFRPTYNGQITTFLQFSKKVYNELPDRVNDIFKIRAPIQVKELYEVDMEPLLNETYTITTIEVNKGYNAEGKPVIEQYTIIPKGSLSLKALQELPIIIVLLYQLYKENIKRELVEYIPSVIRSLTLKPLPEIMADKNFSKEVFVDFMSAQIRTLSFLAYIIRIYQEVVMKNHKMMVEGMLNMLRLCPKEVTGLRRDLFIASRHILSTELRIMFAPHVDELFDEDVLLNRGWTTRETLRPLAYSTLADFVHHIRQHLSMPTIVKAVQLYSLNVHDETLPTGIETMSCKLLLNLVECIQQHSKADPNSTNEQSGYLLLSKILKICVLKFKTIVKLHLPFLQTRIKQMQQQQQQQQQQLLQMQQLHSQQQANQQEQGAQQTPQQTPATGIAETTLEKVEEIKYLQFCSEIGGADKKDAAKMEKKFGFPLTQPPNYTVTDCKCLVRTLTCAIKSATFACIGLKTGPDEEPRKTIVFAPREVNLFIRLIKWALQAFDIYTITVPGLVQGIRLSNQARPRTKEEIEVLEHFNGIFTSLHPQTFREIFSCSIKTLVDRIAVNPSLITISDTFLTNKETSAIYATIMVEFLLNRMSEMGEENQDRSNLYLKLFKTVFDSVSTFSAENEHMLQPYLHQIVNKSMETAMTAKEPYNYFVLLRALFRSIGGGSHDLLYQEFLPLLPTLLQGLNCLQSGLHKQHMKDLFVELCLTVPVRLSSLLPYLPMLMDPLVSAFNGSPTLISQGLRTLELCVDNLQPDFLYDHIQPVRADLMQALWRSLHNTTDQVAHVAFRVLGKLGGGNRKMMNEPQRLDYQSNRTNNPSVVVHFIDYALPINMCLQKMVETAVSALKLTTTDAYYRRQCWEVLKGFIVASISPEENSVYRLLSHPSFTEGPIPRIQGVLYKFNDQIVRSTHISALTGVFVAAAIKDLGKVVVPIMVAIVRHYTMIAISQQAGPFPMNRRQNLLVGYMDSLILAEAIATVMGYEEKELCKPGRLALAVMLSTATTVLGSKKRACELPIMEYLVEKVCALCYERPWYAKLGGCEAIRFLYTKMAINWVYKHLYTFVKAQLFVMMDLSGEVSNGTIDRAKGNLEEMVRRCAVLVDPNTDPELAAVQKKALLEVTYELTRQVTSPNDYLREEAMRLLRVFAEVQNKSITDVMECHKNVLVDIIPPKKHLLRHQAANAQIGLMEGNTFCTTLVPRLFTLDLNIPEHKMFFHEVCNVCDNTDAGLNKLPCYKSIPSLVPLRKAAMKALSACHYVPNVSEKIFNSLYQALERSDPELQEAAFQCMKNFVSGSLIDLSMVHEVMRPLLSTFCDYRNINVSGARRLCYLVQLFPTSFKEKLCEQLLSHMQHFFETLVQQQRSGVKADTKDTEQIIAIIIDIFYHVPAARPRFIEILCLLIFQSEKNLRIGRSSPYHEPLIRFLLKYPLETVVLFLQEKYMREYEWGDYLHFMLKHENSKPFRDVFEKPEIIDMLAALIDIFSKTDSTLTTDEKAAIRYHAIKTVSLIIKFNDQWLASQKKITSILTKIWTDSDSYQEIFVNITAIPHTHWNEPKLIVSILLHYFTHHPLKIDLLFYLMTAFSHRFTSDFQFLKNFLVQTVAQGYTVEWKRSAFLRFCELFHLPAVSEELKARILQFIIIPCFTVSFERNEGERLITSSNKPSFQGTQPENLVTIFLVKLVEEVKHSGCSDSIRILLQQLACVIVEYASHYLNTSKTEGNRLRILMEFVWPCLSGKKCTDSITEYHGHLLLCHIISKMAIHKKIILQVFRSLLKANALEVRPIVRLALDILTPILPNRMEDGYRMLTHWTKKILLEEGHSMPQLVHMLQLIVRHYKVYYPVRHRLIHNLVHSIQRLTVNTSPSLDYRKLAVDLCEVMIKWELQRIRNESDSTETTETSTDSLKRSGDFLSMQARKRFAGGVASPVASTSSLSEESDSNKPIDRMHADAIMNYLTRIACQVNELTTTSGTIGDQLARRCLSIIKTALKSDIWPDNNIDIRLQWVDKLLCSLSGSNPNYGNICTALELVTFVFSVMKKEDVLALCKLLQNGINLCISSSNPKIIRYVHALISRLMSIFPVEPPTSPVASKYEELDKIYSCVAKVILDGLATYEKNANATATSLYGAIMLIKAGCSNNQSYVDRFSSSFVRVIQRLAREHHSSANVETIGVTELLTYCLDMLKNRVGVMKIDTRKTFIATIITGLIERTTDAKLMKALCKLLEEWMVNGKNAGYCGPNVQEKSVLLVKMMQCIEKRFPDLNCQFLEIIYNIYKDEINKPTELMLKLEVAFLSGLRCTNPIIRGKFFELFDSSIQRKLIFRLLYIVSSQNWEGMSQHYWLKQCIELIVVTSVSDERIQLAEGSGMLPSITSVIEKADPDEKALLAGYFAVKEEQSETASVCSMDTSVDEMDIELADSASQSSIELLNSAGGETLVQLVSRQIKFLESVKDFKTFDFLKAAAQLCHMDTSLTEQIWLNIFPQLWKILHDRERTELTGEITPFLASGSHVVQKDAHPSAICTFYESLAHCNPPVMIKPRVMTYLGKSHNLWHRVTLALEKMTIESNFFRDKQHISNDCYDFEPETIPQQDIIDSLADMYSALCEEDMWCGLWQKHAKHPETIIALTYEQQGFFEQALGAYELVLGKARQTYANMPSPISLVSEQRLWEKQWIRCTKELNQWDHLLDYTQTKNLSNPVLILESAWRVPDWNLMKEALHQVDVAYPGILTWKEDLYKGFLAICHPEETLLHLVERYVEQASVQCIKEWRKLPHIVSHVHIHLLQAAQQIIELQEAYQIHQSLLHGRSSTSSLHDIKAIVKTWRNRLPVISDELSHWSDIFTWRQHHYQFVTHHYDTNQDQATRQHSILGVHASAQAIIHFGKIARKQNLTAVCLDSLNRLYTIPSVPIVDCFQKIRQQVKCYLQMAVQAGKSEIQEGLDAIEYTNMRYLTREMTAEFYALKGMFLAQLGRSEEANRAFSVAVQMHDTLVKGWALWGDFMEQQFTKTSPPNISTGISAVTCFLHACRNQNESRSRKYLAKVLWLLTYDDEKFSLTEAVDRYSVGVPPSLWLPWIPQLLTCLGRNEGKYIVNLISQVGRMFPQAVYFPIRTMYFTQKIEQRERYKSAERAAGKQNESSGATGMESSQQSGSSDGSSTIKATPAMLRCSKIMQLQREIHPTILLSLEGIVDQMVWFRENWCEEVLRQLRLGLAKCYTLAFENRGAVNDANISVSTHNFLKKLVSTFGIGLEMYTSSVSTAFGNAGSESLARRTQITMSDPAFQTMKQKFADDFDFSVPGAMKLHNFISKLKKWIRLLENKIQALPKSFLIEEKCRFLSNFSLQTAEIELPGEFLLPKHSHYYVRIARFMPRVEIVEKHNTATRRLYIRGHNGKIYAYLIMQESGMGDARREEIVLQLMRMLNHYLTKQKETSRRFLNYTVSRVVAVSPQLRLVEDNPASLSLLDICKQMCSKKNAQYDEPLTKYYDRLAFIQARGGKTSHQVLRDILMDVQISHIPPNLLKTWAFEIYKTPTDYWTFRKMITLQLSLSCFAEYVFHLTRLNPDMMFIHQDSGLINVSYFKFDVDDSKSELNGNRAVPFRLTPNLSELITEIGICGPLIASMIAIARCFSYPNFKLQTILRALLRDEMITSYKRKLEEENKVEDLNNPPADVPGEMIVTMVTNSVNSIMQRLSSLTNFDGVESKVATLVNAAKNVDNLCRMDPAWHPWL
ncbi:transformation/transcription domain-associated protein isoform X2 [Planococcus citri]|uniref:transformation/transcription domain-associated protein isoform X2 n=1 Tax=Planococcus citri TaxID=170843 RepID=UPI0031F92796